MKNSSTGRLKYFCTAAGLQPYAFAYLKGAPAYSDINGYVFFFKTAMGVLIAADIKGLPQSSGCGFFGFHIHEGSRCAGSSADAFAEAYGHYNPKGTPHPCHAGDMPPLLSDNGYAFCLFLTDRLTAEEIIGHTVIIHSKPDDFTTQPSGNSGEKIACGVIKKY